MGVGRETLRRWVAQAEVDDGARPGTTTAEAAEIRRLKAENKRLREANRDPQGRLDFLRGRTRLPQPLIMGFIDTMRAQGFAVESICQVLGKQGVQVAARTYRAWKAPGRQVAARTVCDAVVADALLGARISPDGRPTPESLYGRRKMTALLRRRGLPVAHCTVDRLMRELGMHGVRRGKSRAHHDPGPRRHTGPETCWTATSPRQRPTGSGLPTSPTCAPGPALVYVAFVVDVYAQRIVGWHAERPARPSWSCSRCAWPPGPAASRATPSSAASWSTTPMPGRSISRSGSPSTCSWKGSRPRSARR